MRKSIIFGLIIVTVVVLLDQISKACMIALLQDNNPIVIIEGFFKLYLTYNTGAAFSILDGQFGLLMALTVVATIVFIYMARYANFNKAKLYSFGIYMMIGGMIGNLIDRIFQYGTGVTDFLSFTFWGWDFAVFNIADSFLVVGVIFLLVDMLFLEHKRNKKIENNKDFNGDN